MRQIILRVTDSSDDAEMLTFDAVTNREYFKTVSLTEVFKAIKNVVKDRVNTREKLHLLHPEIIALNKNRVMIKQSERKRIVTYEDKAFHIHFPNSVYIMYFDEKKISNIEAYTYLAWNEESTQLYAYPFPNMLSGNRVCIGSAPREIQDQNYVHALENVIFTRYSHRTVDNIKSFKDTIKYFEYLEKNDFPYELLIDLKKELREVMR